MLRQQIYREVWACLFPLPVGCAIIATLLTAAIASVHGEAAMQWAALLADVIKALAWPAAVVTIAYWFRDDLRKKIPGLTKAGPTGVEFDVQKRVVAKSWTGELKEIPGISRTPTMALIEKSIHEALQIYNPDSHVDLLVRQLAQSRLEGVFERVYGPIFGSQILGLRALAAKPAGKVLRGEALQFFDELKSKSVISADIAFEAWLQYLVAFDLVKKTDDEVSITDVGRDFLMFLSAKGLPENRPG